MTDAPTRDDLREELQRTLESDGWQKVILPKLRSRLETARAGLESGTGMSIEYLRALQHEIGILRELVERPRETFKP